MEVIVVGGGAAGMAAAISSAKSGKSVAIIERAPRLGRKLAVTGNGRCNLTNTNMSPDYYHGDRDFISQVLEALPLKETLDFFRSLGLITVQEPSGRVYPYSDQAGSVVDVLRFALEGLNVKVMTDTQVQEILPHPGGFTVTTPETKFKCENVIVTCGGAAGVKAGGSTLGYGLLERLGHSCTTLRPSLVQLKTDNKYTRPLKGVRAQAAVTVLRDGRQIAGSRGEVQFTDYGVSGPAVFDISREAAACPGAVLVLDLMPDISAEELSTLMSSRRSSSLTLENLLTGTLHNKLGRTVISRCGLSLSSPCSSLSRQDVDSILRCIKEYILPVTGSLGMEGAQVTAGGISTKEFDPATLESRIVPGLYAAGELLDVDGDCGGYNLQWAWSSGFLAGQLKGGKPCTQ